VSVCLSVHLSHPGTVSKWCKLKITKSSPWAADVGFPSNKGIKQGYLGTPSKRRYFDPIGSSIVKAVADRYTQVAYHNKHC